MALRGITPFERINAAMAQLVERVLGKDEVTGSNPVISSIKMPDRTKGSVGCFFSEKTEQIKRTLNGKSKICPKCRLKSD